MNTMLDEDLKRVRLHLLEMVAYPNTHFHYLDDKSVVAEAAILLSRLSAADERERELVEALRPFAFWAERMPEGSFEMTSDIINVVGNAIANRHLTGAHFRNAARLVQAKDPTP
jgi:hypothetical protein